MTTGRDYNPRNSGAIWIVDGGGEFLKTLNVWAAKRKVHLNAWNSATSTAGMAGNIFDAVTGATLSTHRLHTANLDLHRCPQGDHAEWRLSSVL